MDVRLGHGERFSVATPVVREHHAVLATIVMFLVPVTAAVGINIAFGYDEAVYAGLARQLVTGIPAVGWGIHRPPGMSLLATLPIAAGLTAEWSSRAFGVAAGTGLIVAAWWFARRTGGTTAGLIAAVTVAAASPVQVAAASFLTDLPATLLLVVTAALTWKFLTESTWNRTSLVLAAFVAAAAFYVRYGSLFAIGALAVAAVVAAPRRVTERATAVAIGAFVFASLLGPHFVQAILETGSPFGIIASAERAAGAASAPSILSYAAWYPWQLMGPLAALVGLAGVLGVIRSLVRPRVTTSPHFAAFAGVTVLVDSVGLSTLVHAEPRYLLFPMTLLIILGAIEIAGYGARIGADALNRRSALLGVTALVVGGAVTMVEITGRAGDWNWTRDVARDIAADVGSAAPAGCSVLAADVPIVAWYSGCAAVDLVAGPLDEQTERLTGSHRYLVLRDDGPVQPHRSEIQALVTARGELVRAYENGHGDRVAELYRLRGIGRH